MESSGRIQLVLKGKDVSPSTIPVSELVSVMTAIDQFTHEAISLHRPNMPREAFMLGLHAITDNCITLEFSTSLPEIAIPVFSDTVSQLTGKDYYKIPYSVRKKLAPILAFVKRHRGSADLRVKNGDLQSLATITTESEFLAPTKVRGETTLYGKLVRVGGVDPKAVIELRSGEPHLYAKAERRIIQGLAASLYQTIAVRGIAEWDAETYFIEDFEISEVLSYRERPLLDAIKDISSSLGDYYQSIPDVTKFINDLRADD